MGSRLLSLTCSHPDSCVYLGFESQDRILLIYSFLSGCQREVNKKLKFISIGALIANNKMEITSMAFDFFFKCYIKTLFAFAWFIAIFMFYHLPSSLASSSFIPPRQASRIACHLSHTNFHQKYFSASSYLTVFPVIYHNTKVILPFFGKIFPVIWLHCLWISLQ